MAIGSCKLGPDHPLSLQFKNWMRAKRKPSPTNIPTSREDREYLKKRADRIERLANQAVTEAKANGRGIDVFFVERFQRVVAAVYDRRNNWIQP